MHVEPMARAFVRAAADAYRDRLRGTMPPAEWADWTAAERTLFQHESDPTAVRGGRGIDVDAWGRRSLHALMAEWALDRAAQPHPLPPPPLVGRTDPCSSRGINVFLQVPGPVVDGPALWDALERFWAAGETDHVAPVANAALFDAQCRGWLWLNASRSLALDLFLHRHPAAAPNGGGSWGQLLSLLRQDARAQLDPLAARVLDHNANTPVVLRDEALPLLEWLLPDRPPPVPTLWRPHWEAWVPPSLVPSATPRTNAWRARVEGVWADTPERRAALDAHAHVWSRRP